MEMNVLIRALDAALVKARTEYRNAVIALAKAEAAKGDSSTAELANVDHIHSARTRIIALEAARHELSEPDDGNSVANS